MALLIGFLLSIGVGYPFMKFQVQRFAQLIPAVGFLAWFYRRQPPAFFSQPVIGGWYGLGLVGFVLSAFLASIFGPASWISIGFLGLALLQFGLLPLVRPVWNEWGRDAVRVLALFAVAVLGIDVGLWVIDHVHSITPYAWVIQMSTAGVLSEAPYAFLNARWANQAAVLLIWSYIPLLDQLQSGLIRSRRSFWWFICGLIPVLASAQIVFSAGRGALVSLVAAAVVMSLLGFREQVGCRRLVVLCVCILLVSLLMAFSFNYLLTGGEAVVDIARRNAQELVPAAPDVNKRTVLWTAFLKGIWSEGLQGVGIGQVAERAPTCTPHSLLLALLYWTGLPGLIAAAFLATAFVPRRWAMSGASLMAVPLLVALLLYQLVDDIWLRSFSLSLLFVLLPALKSSALSGGQLNQPKWLQLFAFPGSTYRLIALTGVLLISLSTVVPGGIGFGPSELVSVHGRACMLFF